MILRRVNFAFHFSSGAEGEAQGGDAGRPDGCAACPHLPQHGHPQEDPRYRPGPHHIQEHRRGGHGAQEGSHEDPEQGAGQGARVPTAASAGHSQLCGQVS